MPNVNMPTLDRSQLITSGILLLLLILLFLLPSYWLFLATSIIISTITGSVQLNGQSMDGFTPIRAFYQPQAAPSRSMGTQNSSRYPASNGHALG